jgi:hypothetical protein
MVQAWDPDFAERAPAFVPLRASMQALRCASFPDCADFNRLLAARSTPIRTVSGHALSFVAHALRQPAFEDQYEPRIYLRGEVQLRPGNWHDLFNALVWFAFPLAKAALNERQFNLLARQRATGAANRGPAQDALTLFDEGGVIVATGDCALSGLLTNHAWKELFWRRRAGVNAHMRFLLLGHALYERMLDPFVGVTGRGIACGVGAEFFDLPPALQAEHLDGQLAAWFADPAHCAATRELAAVPLLGIPGWCRDNEHARYYDNTQYFRPPRVGTSACRR